MKMKNMCVPFAIKKVTHHYLDISEFIVTPDLLLESMTSQSSIYDSHQPCLDSVFVLIILIVEK